MKPLWFEDINPEWLPYLETLWKDSKVKVEGTYEATSIQDIVHHFSHESVVIEAIDNQMYVMFSSEVAKELLE